MRGKSGDALVQVLFAGDFWVPDEFGVPFRLDLMDTVWLPVIFFVGTRLVLTVVTFAVVRLPVAFFVGTGLVLTVVMLAVVRLPGTLRVILTVLPGGRICK